MELQVAELRPAEMEHEVIGEALDAAADGLVQVARRYEPPRRQKHLWGEMRTGRWAPTLVGRLELESALDLARAVARGAESPGAAQLEILELRALRTLLRRYPIIPWRDTVYCHQELIGRKLAERMIAAFLDCSLNGQEQERLKPYRFGWKRCKTMVIPMTLNARKKKRAKETPED